jgi:phosphatidylglycerophosphate synthase
VLVLRTDAGLPAAALVLAAWFCDRADGLLARRQESASASGAWLDANVDELVDVALHVAVAWAAARQTASPWPWTLLIAFLAGKYLLMYGLSVEPSQSSRHTPCTAADGTRSVPATLRWLYHLPGNADVRVHVLVVALAANCLAAELAFVAI